MKLIRNFTLKKLSHVASPKGFSYKTIIKYDIL